MTHRVSASRMLVAPLLLLVSLAIGGQARADDVDAQFSLRDGRLGVRLIGEGRDRAGTEWGGVLEFDGDSPRGDFAWAVPVHSRRDRYRGRAVPYDRRPDVRLRGDWEQDNSAGRWAGYYRNGSRGDGYWGGRVRFVPRERPRYRDDPYDARYSDRYGSSRGRYDDTWEDYPLPSRHRATRSDRSRTDEWRDATGSSRDERNGRDDWEPYDPGTDRGDGW